MDIPPAPQAAHEQRVEQTIGQRHDQEDKDHPLQLRPTSLYSSFEKKARTGA
jgi:hypothetical protein